MYGGKEMPLLEFVTQMKLKSVCQNFVLKLAHHWVKNCLCQRKEGNIFLYHFQKDQRCWGKFTFNISKFKFQNGLKQKLNLFELFYTNGSVGAKPPKKCANIIADYKPCHQYEDFGTWVGNQSEMVVWPCGDNREAFLGLLQISLIVKMNLSRNLNLFGCHKKNFTAL